MKKNPIQIELQVNLCLVKSNLCQIRPILGQTKTNHNQLILNLVGLERTQIRIGWVKSKIHIGCVKLW